jgi:hypothetical protein
MKNKKGGNMKTEGNEISTPEPEKTLRVMRLLTRDLTRGIIRSLLKSPKDLRTLCQEVGKRKTAVYEAVRDLVNARIASERFLKTGGIGRTKKEYSINEISIPAISQDIMLDFLEGKDISSKSVGVSDVSIALDMLSERAPVSPFEILVEMLRSKIEPKYAIQILIDLGSSIGETSKDYEGFIEDVIGLMSERYPIEKDSIRIFASMATRTISVDSSDLELTLGIEDLAKIAGNELNLNDYASEFIASKALFEVKILGFEKIGYEFLVILMYINATQMGIECKKPDYYVESLMTRRADSPAEIYVREGSRVNLWKAIQITDFLQRRFRIEKETAAFLSRDLLEQIRYFEFDSYDISFIEALTKEIMRKRKI